MQCLVIRNQHPYKFYFFHFYNLFKVFLKNLLDLSSLFCTCKVKLGKKIESCQTCDGLLSLIVPSGVDRSSFCSIKIRWSKKGSSNTM